MYKLLQDMDVENKRVIVRCDFNVPMKDNQILDDYKIISSLETIYYLLERNAKIILLSHLGKVKKESDKTSKTLVEVAKKLKSIAHANVIFSKQTKGEALKQKIMSLKAKDIILLENTRYEDVTDKLESGCNMDLAKYWASLGEVFVFDAFGTSHRRHASTYGISRLLPTCIGFLVQKEMKMLNDYVLDPEKPFTIMMGGAKVEDKLELMNKLLPKCDYMLLTGGLANTCLKVLNFNVGTSLASKDPLVLKNVKDLLVKYKDKIVLPYDAIVANSFDDQFIDQKNISEVDANESIKDIGIKTLNVYKDIIGKSKTVFLNGTAGVYEDNRFANGTKEMLEILSKSQAKVIVGGGDSTSAVRNFGYANNFLYISTGGGATLEYIINEKLIALEDKEEEIEVL